MTIYGGKDRGDGVILDGFLVVCAKCGWHSEVEIFTYYDPKGWGTIINCAKCNNRAEV